MNAEQLHDALNYLDDDMLATVDALRGQKPKRLPLFRIAGLAACLCLLAGAAFWRFGMPVFVRMESENMVSVNDSYYSAETGGAEHYAAGSDSLSLSLLLTVTEYTDTGLTGTVTGILNTELFPVGTQVAVHFADSPQESSGHLYGNSYCAARLPEPDSGEVTVQVSFTRWEETEDGIVIYAEKIEGGQS